MQDILENTDGGLIWENGDISWGEASQQHQRDILLARKGEYRLAPSATVGIADFLQDDNPDEMNRDIRRRFAQDGLTISSMKILNGSIQIDAKY